MSQASYDFNYDGQIERFLVQFIRMMSGYQVEFGEDRNGVRTLQRVPVYYGDSSRQVAAIISNNSENAIATVPAMTVYISNLTYDRDRMQDPTYVDTMNVRERAYNETTQEYENRQGSAFTVERLMPVPWTLELKLDIWTSNAKQKLQLWEQITLMYNPGFEIQSTDNYIAWNSLSIAYLDGQNFSSRTVPIGTENPIDIATLTFKLPIWLSPPAKVKKMGIIKKIIASIHDSNGDLNSAAYSVDNLLGRRQFFTPLDYSVLLIGNTLTLLKENETEMPHEPTLGTSRKLGTRDEWESFINMYGVFESGITQVRLTSEDETSEVVGTVSTHPTDDTLLIFNADIDTYPANTLAPITAIIDPQKTTVASITSPVTGTRYLILNNIGSFANATGTGPEAWRGTNGVDLVAKAYDIIEYNGTNWIISLDSTSTDTVQFVSNLTTGTQYKWNLQQWVKSWEGAYPAGMWTLVI